MDDYTEEIKISSSTKKFCSFLLMAAVLCGLVYTILAFHKVNIRRATIKDSWLLANSSQDCVAWWINPRGETEIVFEAQPNTSNFKAARVCFFNLKTKKIRIQPGQIDQAAYDKKYMKSYAKDQTVRSVSPSGRYVLVRRQLQDTVILDNKNHHVVMNLGKKVFFTHWHPKLDLLVLTNTDENVPRIVEPAKGTNKTIYEY
jgi:hypothetical protein